MLLPPRLLQPNRWMAFTVGLIVGATTASAGSAAPSYAVDPAVVRFDVDASWPRRPNHVSDAGWVSGMAIDGDQNVWIFKKGPDPVQVYTPAGEFVRTWGKNQFSDPHHLRIDPRGHIWVADFGRHVVSKYTPEGKLLLTLGTEGEAGEDETHFNRPTDMAITPEGDIFVTDGYGNRRVVHFDREGKFVRSWGEYGTRPGQFVLPHAIVVDSKGRLYVADRNSGRIQVFDQQGHFVDQWSNVIMPWGLCVTRRDDFWVCGSSPHWWYQGGEYQEFKDQVFMRFTADGRVRQVWSIPLGDPAHPQPGDAVGVHCIAEDANGNLYVGDIYSERAQKFVPVRMRRETDEQ